MRADERCAGLVADTVYPLVELPAAMQEETLER
jgi:hypothetical protein